MKVYLVAMLAVLLYVVPFEQAQKPSPVSGRWEGTIEYQGQKIPTIFEIAADHVGQLEGRIFCSEQPICPAGSSAQCHR